MLFVSHAGGAWVNSDLGASNLTVTNGDDIGFRYDSADRSRPAAGVACRHLPRATPPPTPTRTPAPSARSTPTPRTAILSWQAPQRRRTPATPTLSTTPTAGILGVATPGATVGAAGLRCARRVSQPGINVGILLAAIGAGALLGLLGIQRASPASRMNPRALAAWSLSGITIALATGNPVYRVLVLLCALNV